MSNFGHIVKVNQDYATKLPDLRIGISDSGKEKYSGRVYWRTGRKNKDGKAEYLKPLFYTWNREVFNTFSDNPNASFLIEATVYPAEYTKKDGTKVESFNLQIEKATIHVWEEKLAPHWQEEKHA